MMKQQEATKAASGRVKRPSLAVKGPLAVRGKDDKFHYRIVNNVDDRVLDFQERGYEVVTGKDTTVGDKRVDSASAEGSVKEFNVGSGSKAVLMRIPKEWYDEDQAEKLVHLQQLEDATKKDALSGHYGKLDLTRD